MVDQALIVDNLDQRESDLRKDIADLRDKYWRVGMDISALYNDGTWKKRDLPWKEYCFEYLGITYSYASRLMTAGDIYAQLPSGLQPANEGTARELNGYPLEVQIPAMQIATEVAKSEGKITARIVRLAVRAASFVATEALQTQGYAETEDGQQQVLNAAVTKQVLETLLRQSEHIAAKSNRQMLGAFSVPAYSAMTRLNELLNEIDTPSNQRLHIRVYVDSAEEVTT